MGAELLVRSSEVASVLLRVAGWETLFSAILFPIVLVLTWLLRRASPVLRHALWGLVLLRLALPIDFWVPYSLGSLAGEAEMAPVVEAVWSEAWPSAAASQSDIVSEASAAQAVEDSEAGPDSWLVLVLALWLAGASAIGYALFRKRRFYERLVRRSSPVSDPEVLAMASRWRIEFGIRQSVRIVTSAELRSPFTFGSLRPVVYLPRAILELGRPELLESVLAHEMAHVSRRDEVLLQLQLLLSALYFFNPVAWLSARRMREESERICDALVLSRGSLSARTYGQSIVAVLRIGLPSGPNFIPALAGTKERLEMRLKTLMRREGTGTPVRTAYSLPLAFALGLFLLPMARGPQVENGPVRLYQPQEVVLANPMPGSRITAAWGPMVSPFTGKEVHHRGIDVVGTPGAEIYAPAAGVVEVATVEYSGGRDHGTVVILDHGSGIKTFYSHLDVLAVREGQRVSQGEALGTQGSTGKVTGAHLHFEVWVDGEYTDPALFVAEWSE
ncbi:MAG: hypothetical protein AMS18_04175 [Gemmatimonas sp. SG8_17]|nr:MAG: hypothetical protein AMS18_04175 [Gemmatimonas sp. SG8_17]